MWYVDPSDITGKKPTRIKGTPANRAGILISLGFSGIFATVLYGIFEYQRRHLTEEDFKNVQPHPVLTHPEEYQKWLQIQGSYHAYKYNQKQEDLNERLRVLNEEIKSLDEKP